MAPPQVPSHYAPNYPLGHPRRERGPGYSTLPLHAHAGHQQHNANHNVHATTVNQHTSPPQIGTVHPLQSHPQTPPPAPPSVTQTTAYMQDHHTMPRKLKCNISLQLQDDCGLSLSRFYTFTYIIMLIVNKAPHNITKN